MEFFITKNLKKLIAITSLFLGISVNAATNDTDIKIVKVNDSNFEKEILFSDKPVILDITSTSCPPCLIMIPTLIDIAKKIPRY